MHTEVLFDEELEVPDQAPTQKQPQFGQARTKLETTRLKLGLTGIFSLCSNKPRCVERISCFTGARIPRARLHVSPLT